jgi:hypothetical protein
MNRQPFNITTEEQFQELMEDIDRELRNDNVRIPGRPLHAMMKVGNRFGLCLRLVSASERPPIEGCYTGDDLVIRMMQWFDGLYGERLGMDFPTGSMALWVRGDLYMVRFPKTWGVHTFMSASHLLGTRRVIVRHGVPYINLLESIEGMTPALAKSLTEQEQRDLGTQFVLGFEAQRLVREREHLPLVKQAMGNLDSSVSLLFASPSQYGQSKWESLQATEKLLKAYIDQQGQKFPPSHDLRCLAKLAQKLGLPPIPDVLLQQVQCTAAVRYGEQAVEQREAVDTQHTALEVCGLIAGHLPRPPVPAR